MENARFGSLSFWGKSRGKCSFWKLGALLLGKVPWKMLVSEAWSLIFGQDSWKMLVYSFFLVLEIWLSLVLVLEVRIFICGENLLENVRFGSLNFALLVKVLRSPVRVSSKIVRTRVSSKSVLSRLPLKSAGKEFVQQECQARVPPERGARKSGKSVKAECPFKSAPLKHGRPAKLSSKIAQQECQVRASRKSVTKECPVKSVQQGCPGRASSKSVQLRVSSKSGTQKFACKTAQQKRQARALRKSAQQRLSSKSVK